MLLRCQLYMYLFNARDNTCEILKHIIQIKCIFILFVVGYQISLNYEFMLPKILLQYLGIGTIKKSQRSPQFLLFINTHLEKEKGRR